MQFARRGLRDRLARFGSVQCGEVGSREVRKLSCNTTYTRQGLTGVLELSR